MFKVTITPDKVYAEEVDINDDVDILNVEEMGYTILFVRDLEDITKVVGSLELIDEEDIILI